MVERVKPQAPKITKFDRNACMILRADLEMALAGIAAKHGIKIDLGKMGFSAHNVKVSLEAAVIGEGGIVLDRAAIDFKQLASLSIRLRRMILARNLLSKERNSGSRASIRAPNRCPVRASRSARARNRNSPCVPSSARLAVRFPLI